MLRHSSKRKIGTVDPRLANALTCKCCCPIHSSLNRCMEYFMRGYSGWRCFGGFCRFFATICIFGGDICLDVHSSASAAGEASCTLHDYSLVIGGEAPTKNVNGPARRPDGMFVFEPSGPDAYLNVAGRAAASAGLRTSRSTSCLRTRRLGFSSRMSTFREVALSPCPSRSLTTETS
jgi:hypothetical protein